MSIAGPADSFKFLIRYRNDKFWTALAVAETVDRRILVSPAPHDDQQTAPARRYMSVPVRAPARPGARVHGHVAALSAGPGSAAVA